MSSPNTIAATAIVALGGGVGAMLRFHAGRAVNAITGPSPVFPWGTFAVNIVGSLAMGLLAGWLAREGGSESMRLLLGVGVLGGFTTFSAFSLEMALLIQRGLHGMAAIYALGSVLAGVSGLFIGLSLMRGAA